MLYSEDWLLRQIESMVDAIINKLTGKTENSNQTEYVVLQDEIDSLLEKNNICEAENLILENLNASNAVVALEFYRRINKLSEEELNEANFSHKEIYEGIRRYAQKPV